MTMTHGSLFSGIGGFDLAASWMGWKNAFHCEIDEFCSRVLKYHFPDSELMETSRQQTLHGGEARLMSSPEDSPASLSALPDEGEERRMTATSGRRCSALSGKSGRLGLSVRMLLESSRWYSPARRLQWQARPLYSERITKRRICVSGMSSRRSALTLSVRDIPSSRLSFRLVPSVRPTGGTGYGLLQDEHKAMNARINAEKTLLPTVMTQGLKISNEKGAGGVHPAGFAPTPMSTEVRHERRVRELKEAGGDTLHSRVNGETRPNGLMDYLDFHGVLPTPTASCQNVGCPKARKDGTLRTGQLNHLLAYRTGHASQLNPRYVAEMMGFPSGWTESPFLAGGRSL